METEVRNRYLAHGTFEWRDIDEMFAERLAVEDFSGATVLDLGTGRGRLALDLAPRAGIVVGIDTNEEALAAARDRARGLGISNVNFISADADASNYRLIVRSPLDYVVANHFMSEPAIRASAIALRPGGRFLFACHHEDHWIESGRAGYFSFSLEGMRNLLTANSLTAEFLGIERLVVTYRSLEEVAEAEPGVHEKFLGDGRWPVLASRFGDGPARLTWSTLVGVAAKP